MQWAEVAETAKKGINQSHELIFYILFRINICTSSSICIVRECEVGIYLFQARMNSF